VRLCWWRRHRFDPSAEFQSDGRLPDGDTVLQPGAVRWTTLYRSQCARTTGDRPLMTPGQEHRSRRAPWLGWRWPG
jgi:hypothetical protein